MGGPETVLLIEAKDKYRMISLIYGILKSDANELIYKTEIDSQTLRMNIRLPGRKNWGRDS